MNDIFYIDVYDFASIDHCCFAFLSEPVSRNKILNDFQETLVL